MALLAFAMCVNFTACSDDDPNPEPEKPSVNKERKLVEMKFIDNGTQTRNYIYDDKGHLLRVDDFGDDHNCTTDFIWGNNTIKSISDGNVRTYKLENGLIVSTHDSDNDLFGGNAQIKYDSNKRRIEYKDFDSYETTTIKYIWDNDRFSKEIYSDVDNQWGNTYESTTCYEYEGKKCNGYLPLLLDQDNDIILDAHPELMGFRITQLPSRSIEKSEHSEWIQEFDYILDEKGYVINMEIRYLTKDIESGTIREEEEQNIAFKWE